jgi:transcriptional regulator with XRE-family HTH domain
MTKPFGKLLESMPVERRSKIAAKTRMLKQQMALRELRQALDLTQEELASSLKINQAAISKFENQSDIYISTLRRILSAMGGDLRIIAHFPEGDVLINQFGDLHVQAETAGA